MLSYRKKGGIKEDMNHLVVPDISGYKVEYYYLNTTPKNYIETRRLVYARKLLKDGYSVKDAAYKSGFSNTSNFIRLFKSRFGITPKAYKMS